MLRVLMVLEDYNDLVFYQSVLKKMGFDAAGIQNPHLLDSSMITLNPDILILTAEGKRIKGLELWRSLKRPRGVPKVIFLHSPDQMPWPDSENDLWVKAPASALVILDAIARLQKLDQKGISEKFTKLKLPEFQDDEAQLIKAFENLGTADGNTGAASPSGRLMPSSLTNNDRRERYKKFLQTETPKDDGFSGKKVQEMIKALRDQETKTYDEDLEKQRRAFVEELFKKKGSG